MFGGHGTTVDGRLPPARARPGVRVGLAREAERSRRLEQAPCLLRGEQARLAGDVVERRDSLPADCGQRRDHVRRVGVGVDAGRDDMRAEERDDEAQRRERAALIEQFELVELGARR